MSQVYYLQDPPPLFINAEDVNVGCGCAGNNDYDYNELEYTLDGFRIPPRCPICGAPYTTCTGEQ